MAENVQQENGAVINQENDQGGQGVQNQNALNERQPTRLESFMALVKSLLLRAMVIYFISSFFRKPAADTTPTQVGQPQSKVAAWNYFENGTMFDLYIYLSDDYDRVDFGDSKSLVWLEEGLMYGDWDDLRTHNIKFSASPKLMNNGSIYIHTYALKAGKSPDPTKPNFADKFFSHSRSQLNKFKKIKKVRTKNLLSAEKEQFERELDDALEEDRIVSHWHPNLTINMVTDQTNWVRGTVPPPLDEYVKFVGTSTYLPILYLNDYWNMMRDYQPINETTPELELYLTYQPLSLFKWQLYAAQQMRNKWTNNIFGEALTSGTESDEDQDSLKETLLDTNPYLLGMTIAVSILHSIFELLAFKNDIQFWNNRKSLEGLSVRSVFFGVVQSVIVLLYVLDNETNFMIKISCFIGLGIEVWKIQKVSDINFDREHLILGFLPRISFSDKGSYVESSTKQYDKLAFKYLGWVCFPLLVGYSIYSLVYLEHKGWYSFVLNLLYGFLLTFGFIMMTPQLFINYKMKSVAHLPWRMMTYKFLNTFIDDIFAFVIKMPVMYRLGCFRDDIVFFVFLYQRWIYKVDAKRINEFGFSAEMLEQHKSGATTDGEPKAIEESTKTPEGSPSKTKNKRKTAAEKKDE